MTTEEKLIKFLNNKFKTAKTNKISINKYELSQIGLSEQEVIKSVYVLHQDKILEIKRMSIHNDLSTACEVLLCSECIHYFENRRKTLVDNRRNWVQTYIPNILSIIAVGISIIALLVGLCR